MNFEVDLLTHVFVSRSGHTGGHAPEYEQPRAGNANRRSGDLRRDPSDASTASPAEHRIKLHGQWAMRDRQASTTRHPRPSLLIPRPRETTPPNLPHKLKQRLHDQTRAVAAPDTLVYSNPIGRRISHDMVGPYTISHDMVGPYTISHDLPRSPTTWSAHRSTAHGPAAFLALSAAKISLCPCISHDLPRSVTISLCPCSA